MLTSYTAPQIHLCATIGYSIPNLVAVVNLLDTVTHRVLLYPYRKGRDRMARQMTERIAISPQVKAKLMAFKGDQAMTFDQAIELLLKLGTLEGMDVKSSGVELRYAEARGKKITPVKINS